MLELNFTPFPTLTTNRLTLRRIVASDAQQCFNLRNSATVMKYIDRPMAHKIEDAWEWIKKVDDGINNNQLICWAISLKEDPTLIGTISYHRIIKEHHRAEIGYMLHPLHWRKGLLTEAAREVIEYGFRELKLHSIEANVNPLNKASMALLKKFHFVLEAHFHEDFYFNGKFLDSYIFSLLERHYSNGGTGIPESLIEGA